MLKFEHRPSTKKKPLEARSAGAPKLEGAPKPEGTPETTRRGILSIKTIQNSSKSFLNYVLPFFAFCRKCVLRFWVARPKKNIEKL